MFGLAMFLEMVMSEMAEISSAANDVAFIGSFCSPVAVTREEATAIVKKISSSSSMITI